MNMKDYSPSQYVGWNSERLEYWKKKIFDGFYSLLFRWFQKLFCIPAVSVPSEAVILAPL
jgi:hypothetical protein